MKETSSFSSSRGFWDRLGTGLLCSLLGTVGGFLAIAVPVIFFLIGWLMFGYHNDNSQPPFEWVIWTLRFTVPIGWLVGFSIGAFCD